MLAEIIYSGTAPARIRKQADLVDRRRKPQEAAAATNIIISTIFVALEAYKASVTYVGQDGFLANG
jgi:hypothetical protein